MHQADDAVTGAARPCSLFDNNPTECANSKACHYIPAQGTISAAKCEEMILDCPDTVAKQGLPAVLCDGDFFRMTAIEETCAGKDGGAKPYACPVAQGGCAKDWIECVTQGGAHPCPADKPISCWGLTGCLAANASAGAACADQHCKATLPECGCPPPYQTCQSDQSCVLDTRVCPPACPAETPVACPDRTCAASAELCASAIACPAGQITCFDASSCAADLTSCNKGVDLALCTGSRPLTCPDGKTCVSSYADCPTAQICPDNTVLCPDSSCKADSRNCSALPTCYPPTPYQCADGSCSNFLANCPTTVTCPERQPVLCPDKSCKATSAECVIPPACDAQSPILCPDGSCQQSSLLCPSISSCPAAQPTKCPDGSCTVDVDSCLEDLVCPPDAQGQPTFSCPDGSCVVNLLTCPSTITCPGDHPTKCWDNSCAKNLTDCVSPAVSCPQRLPLRCPTGACVASIEDCPQDTRCSSKWPVKCIDGSCKESIDKCPTVSQATGTACPAGQVRCPMGSCAVSLGLCPKSISCEYGAVKCWDGSCRVFNATTKVDPCPDKLLLDSACPKVGFETTTGAIRCPDGSCVDSLVDCPTERVCPAELGVLCPDKTCNESIAQCTPFSPCPSNKVLCPDGTCELLAEDCGRPVTCTDKTPYKCFDQTCRKAVEDCPKPPQCHKATPFLCSDGNCKGARESCLNVGKCPILPCYREGYCVRCPGAMGTKGFDADGRCIDPTAKGCVKDSCAKSMAACSAWQDEVQDAAACLAGFQRCPVDGSCRKIEDASKCPDVNDVDTCEACPKATCPTEAPVRCDNGMCVAGVADCGSPAATLGGCPFGKSRCADGTCADTCAPAVENATCASLGVTGGASKTLCADGSCRASCAYLGDPSKGDVQANGCPASTPILCFGSSGKCVATAKECKVEQYCQVPSLYRCPDGLCAASSLHCARQETPPGMCPPATPSACADGTCAATLAQCGVVRPCAAGEIRCVDGTCKSSADLCRVGGTHLAADGSPMTDADGTPWTTFCPAARPFRCEIGTCAESRNRCTSLDVTQTAATSPPNSADVGCNLLHPFKCTDTGACVATAADCTSVLSVGSNGCPASASVKCADGSCSASAASCTAASGCPPATPLRCADGSCQSSYAACAGRSQSCPAAAPVRCNDESCVATFQDCLATNNWGLRD